jgi:hypothetical protein
MVTPPSGYTALAHNPGDSVKTQIAFHLVARAGKAKNAATEYSSRERADTGEAPQTGDLAMGSVPDGAGNAAHGEEPKGRRIKFQDSADVIILTGAIWNAAIGQPRDGCCPFAPLSLADLYVAAIHSLGRSFGGHRPGR